MYNQGRRQVSSSPPPPTLYLDFPSSVLLTNVVTTMGKICENPCTPRPRVAEPHPKRHPAPGPGFLSGLRAVAASSAPYLSCSSESTINGYFHQRLPRVNSTLIQNCPDDPLGEMLTSVYSKVLQALSGIVSTNLKIVQRGQCFLWG